MASIQDMLPVDVLVLRDGVQTVVPAADLVPGDLAFVVMGKKVPADLRLIEVSGDLRFDRSVLTGEVSAAVEQAQKCEAHSPPRASQYRDV